MRGCWQRDHHQQLGDNGISNDEAINNGEGLKMHSMMGKIRGVYDGAL